MSSKVYEIITERILDQLREGTAPWRNPIRLPFNIDGWRYRGSNVLLLGSAPFGCPVWFTPRQIRERDGRIRDGQSPFQVVYWIERKSKASTDDDGESSEADRNVRTWRVPRYTRVFNFEQLEGIELPPSVVAKLETKPGSIEEADRIVAGMPDPPKMLTGGIEAFYLPPADVVQLPALGQFESAEAFAVTRFHELVHSTGHGRRLDRGLEKRLAPFGSQDYSFEELIAEMGAAFLMAQAGLETQLEQSAAYIGGWLKKLQSEPEWVVRAGNKAQRAADWITGELARREREREEAAA